MTADAPAQMWFVKAGGQVWGPYPPARLAEFVREGRVGAATLLSPFADGPWSPAAERPEFTASLRRPVLATPAPEPAADTPSRPAGPVLVFAELVSVTPAAFQARLAGLGPCLQVRPGLWLVRAPMAAAPLRNLLSSGLGAGDGLLVVEAPLQHAAWFNLAPAHDRDLRRLWSGG